MPSIAELYLLQLEFSHDYKEFPSGKCSVADGAISHYIKNPPHS